MKIEAFPHSAEVEVEAIVNPSEDEEKVRKAIANLFQKIEISLKKDGSAALVGSARNVDCLHHIYEKIRTRNILGVVRRLLIAHSAADSTWLYFNKQAAYVNVVSLCEEWSESILGPVKATIKCERLDDFINWLAPSH